MRSSGTDILYGCHLLLDVCIIYFISCDYNEFFIILYNILTIAELDCCQIIILSIYVPSTHAYTHVLRLSLDVRLSEWCCSVSMVWVQIPSREEQNLAALKSNSNTVWFNFQTYIYIYIKKPTFFIVSCIETTKWSRVSVHVYPPY